MKKLWRGVGILLFILMGLQLGQSHVGSPGVVFEGKIGRHQVMVSINPPSVIPGTAFITVITDGNEKLSVSAKPVYWSAGYEGTPRADALEPVKGEIGKYKGLLWMMNSGASSVEVIINDGNESASVFVPVMAVATAENEMDPIIGVVLSIMAVLLVAILVTVIASSTGNALLKPGEQVSDRTNKRKLAGGVIGFILVVGILYGGKVWWDNEAERYQMFMYRPMKAEASVIDREDGRYLRLVADESSITSGGNVRQMEWVIPDHGKLMHLFMVRKGSLDVFAHLHPNRLDSVTFESILPPVPAGRYYIFADITRATGFSETLVDTLDIPELPLRFQLTTDPELGRDDTFMITNAFASDEEPLFLNADIMVCGTPGVATRLPDGSKAILEAPDNGKFMANELYKLTFLVLNPYGEPAELEPYLGMMGHAVVMKADASVFIHLHPIGNYSMGAQEIMAERFATGAKGFQGLGRKQAFADSIDRVMAYYDALSHRELNDLLAQGMNHDMSNLEHEEHSVVAFPYAFPEPGKYRIWLQFKREGRILNAAFDIDVEEFKI